MYDDLCSITYSKQIVVNRFTYISTDADDRIHCNAISHTTWRYQYVTQMKCHHSAMPQVLRHSRVVTFHLCDVLGSGRHFDVYNLLISTHRTDRPHVLSCHL